MGLIGILIAGLIAAFFTGILTFSASLAFRSAAS